jgi:hypothetical protein
VIALALPLVGSIVGGIAVLLVGVVLILRYLRARGRAEMDRELRGRAPKKIDDMVNFFGVESRGATQMRGNGCLALVDDELVFIQWVPRQTIRIRLAEIAEVDEANGHLGKTIARKLLRVRWQTAGVEDTVAWYVNDLAGWLADLRAVSTVRARA